MSCCFGPFTGINCVFDELCSLETRGGKKTHCVCVRLNGYSNSNWGCSSVGRASDRYAVEAGSTSSAAKESSSTVNFQCRLSYFVLTPPCATACINICAHVKDPEVYVRVRLIMETLKHPAWAVGWVAGLCRSWLSPGKATRISYGRNPIGTIQL